MKRPLPFHPRAGQVLVADFKGMVAPEIIKVRPVVVISPKLAHRSGLVTIVPLSTTAPRQELPYVFKMSKNYTPWGEQADSSWAKCDLVMSVSLSRLSSFKIDRRKYHSPSIDADDLAGIRKAVLAGLGLDGY